MNRRSFLRAAASAAAFASSACRGQQLPIKKGVLLGMLPKDLSYPDRCRLAREVGFEELECPTIRDAGEAEQINEAAKAAGLRIHSVMNSDHWRYPLSSADPEAVAQSMDCMEVSLRNARLWGADTVLLVPAVVNPETSYAQAWERSQTQIRKLIPLAEEVGVVIAVENVWNKFLVSPLEFARYVDEFDSPWVRAYFDVGNVVLFGYPQDWIRTLNKRIVKLHLKDFLFRRDQATGKRSAEFVALRDGDVEWQQVHKALSEIGYRGTATVEVKGGDRAHLQEISRRVDLILSGA
jgi:hexulose-6-phosphate isomerase